MKINLLGKTYYSKTVEKYLQYLLYTIPWDYDKYNSGINLRNNHLLDLCEIEKSKQYYRGFINNFLKNTRIGYCVNDYFIIGQESKLYKINFSKLIYVINEVKKITNCEFNHILFYKFTNCKQLSEMERTFFNIYLKGLEEIFYDCTFLENDTLICKEFSETSSITWEQFKNSFYYKRLKKITCSSVIREMDNKINNRINNQQPTRYCL